MVIQQLPERWHEKTGLTRSGLVQKPLHLSLLYDWCEAIKEQGAEQGEAISNTEHAQGSLNFEHSREIGEAHAPKRERSNRPLRKTQTRVRRAATRLPSYRLNRLWEQSTLLTKSKKKEKLSSTEERSKAKYLTFQVSPTCKYSSRTRASGAYHTLERLCTLIRLN